jgi:general secretion pathway protein J
MRKTIVGFTLLEILIALFIFTILSIMMVNGLKTVIDIQAGTEQKANQLHKLQLFLLMFSRDIEQAVDRSVRNAYGSPELAFSGKSNELTLTHLGYANPMGLFTRSNLERVSYFSDGGVAMRSVWNVLDQAPTSQASRRILMLRILELRFQYLAEDGRFYSMWPVPQKAKEVLPRAIRVFLTIPNWGRISQLYVISAQANTLT